jgi:hypothetical protein
MARPLSKNRLLGWAVMAVAAVVVVILALVGVGVLRLPNSASNTGTVEVTEVHWTVLQGTLPNSTTTGWFGPFNYTFAGPDDGYPLNVSAGGTFTIALVVSCLGGVPHWVYSAYAASPFTVKSTKPVLPVEVPKGEDDAGFYFTVQVPSTPGAVLALNMTFNALNAP